MNLSYLSKDSLKMWPLSSPEPSYLPGLGNSHFSLHRRGSCWADSLTPQFPQSVLSLECHLISSMFSHLHFPRSKRNIATSCVQRKNSCLLLDFRSMGKHTVGSLWLETLCYGSQRWHSHGLENNSRIWGARCGGNPWSPVLGSWRLAWMTDMSSVRPKG